MSLRTSQVLAPPPKGPGPDPSQTADTKVIFNKEIQLEFRRYRDESEGDCETRLVWVRIMSEPTHVRFEIMDDANLYFLVESVVDEEEFDKLRVANELSIEFGGLAEEVTHLLTESAVQGSGMQVTYFDENDGTGSLIITQSLAVKSVEIFKIAFRPASSELIEAHVQYRFQKLGLALYEKKLQLLEFNKTLRSQNPMLLRVIASPSKSPARK
jgi:hypothetical protein